VTSIRPAAAVPRLGTTPYSAAQTRTAGAALDLFAAHGVSGTSLQMIADATGVTKAAVYHQFRTKEAIVVAAVDLELAELEPALEAAETNGDDLAARAALLGQVVDLAIGRRRFVSTLQHDPVIVRRLGEHEQFQRFMSRLFAALLGGDTDAMARVRVAMIASAIGGAVAHPLVAGLDTRTLRNALVRLSLDLLDPEAARRRTS
jgi:AcrR family transcriptional regulator